MMSELLVILTTMDVGWAGTISRSLATSSARKPLAAGLTSTSRRRRGRLRRSRGRCGSGCGAGAGAGGSGGGCLRCRAVLRGPVDVGLLLPGAELDDDEAGGAGFGR